MQTFVLRAALALKGKVHRVHNHAVSKPGLVYQNVLVHNQFRTTTQLRMHADGILY